MCRGLQWITTNQFCASNPAGKLCTLIKKTKALYNITFYFITKYLVRCDRTIDQMVQAARSGKQNIVEGSAAGVTSCETELKLLNVARASLRELREDYEDYLNVRHLPIWDASHPEFASMMEYCRTHNQPEDFEPYLDYCSAEKIANLALTLCHMADKMMVTYQHQLEQKFIEEGGIRERMTAARLGYRKQQKEYIAGLEQTILQLRQKVAELEQKLRENGLR